MFLNKLQLEVIKIYKFSSLYDYFVYVNRARALCMIFFNTFELYKMHHKLQTIVCLLYNAKFWCAPIGRYRSRDTILSPISGRLSVYKARFRQFSLKI